MSVENDLSVDTVAAAGAASEVERLRLELADEREARRSLEAAYGRSAKESQLLHEAGSLLASTLELDRIYAILRELIGRSMPCSGLVVSRFDPERALITCSYAWVEGSRLDPAGLPSIPLAAEGRGRQSLVIRTGRPLLIADSDSPERASTQEYHIESDGTVRDEPLPGHPRTRSLMMVPIRLDERVLGIVQVQAQQPSAYSEDDLRLLEALVLQLAAAERNAYLYQKTLRELEERRRAESEIQMLNERLRRAMIETHHRVKNNLQVIAAMIDMHLLDDAEAIPRSDILRMGGRIRTLGLVHELLTQETQASGYANALQVDEMLTALVELLQQVAGRVVIGSEIISASVPVRQATALALIVNELVTNAIKHARARIEVLLTETGGELQLDVRDDGPGFPGGFKPGMQGHTGLDLVEHICRWDLTGRCAYGASAAGGARVTVQFPRPALD